MRHLRLFESKDSYYEIITSQEWNSLSETVNMIDFTHSAKMDRWLESLPGFRNSESGSNLFRPFYINDRYYSKRGLQNRNGFRSYRLESEGKESDYIVYILESDDDWFWVRIERWTENFTTVTYWKCDQFDGLKRLLKKMRII